MPADLVPRHQYLRSVIAVALAAWVGGQSASAVRRVVSCDSVLSHEAQRDWPSLRRWVRNARTIFGASCPAPAGSPRSAAGQVVVWLLSHAPPDTATEPVATRIVAGVRNLTI